MYSTRPLQFTFPNVTGYVITLNTLVHYNTAVKREHYIIRKKLNIRFFSSQLKYMKKREVSQSR